MQREVILREFGPNETIDRSSLLSLLSEQYPSAKPTTLDWHIHTMLEKGKLVRRGRGSYAVMSDHALLPAFDPSLPNELITIGKRLNRKFALTTLCLWSTSVLHTYVQQQPFITYWLVETEREAVEPVLDCIIHDITIERVLKKVPTVRADDLALVERYNAASPVILLVKPLISEAPLQRNNVGLDVPTLEKLLVDLVADTDVFGLFGEELPSLFTQLNSRFILNLDRLRRYARRRHKLSPVNDYLNQLPTDLAP